MIMAMIIPATTAPMSIPMPVMRENLMTIRINKINGMAAFAGPAPEGGGLLKEQ